MWVEGRVWGAVGDASEGDAGIAAGAWYGAAAEAGVEGPFLGHASNCAGANNLRTHLKLCGVEHHGIPWGPPRTLPRFHGSTHPELSLY